MLCNLDSGAGLTSDMRHRHTGGMEVECLRPKDGSDRSESEGSNGNTQFRPDHDQRPVQPANEAKLPTQIHRTRSSV